MTGNVVEFAVAVIMAGAIGKVVNGFVSNIVMPVVGMLTGGVNFADQKVVLSEAVLDAAGKVTKAENAITYGCLLYTSPSPRDKRQSRMPSSA